MLKQDIFDNIKLNQYNLFYQPLHLNLSIIIALSIMCYWMLFTNPSYLHWVSGSSRHHLWHNILQTTLRLFSFFYILECANTIQHVRREGGLSTWTQPLHMVHISQLSECGLGSRLTYHTVYESGSLSEYFSVRLSVFSK